MLGYVSQATFNSEREFRKAAEQRATAAERTAEVLANTVATLTELLESQNRRAHESQVDLLDRLEPKPQSPNGSDQVSTVPTTAAEIMARPARTGREMMLRQRMANDASAREKSELDRNRQLPPDEQRMLDQILHRANRHEGE